MSQEENWKADVEALENAASIIQREERKIEGTNLRDGPAAKAKSLADKAADIFGEPNNATINKKYVRPNPELVDDASRTIIREEAKLYGGTPPGGAGANAKSFATRVRREDNPQ